MYIMKMVHWQIDRKKQVYKEESGEVKMEEKDEVRWGNKKSPLV